MLKMFYYFAALGWGLTGLTVLFGEPNKFDIGIAGTGCLLASLKLIESALKE